MGAEGLYKPGQLQRQEREPDPCIPLEWRWEQDIRGGFTRVLEPAAWSLWVFLKVLGQAVPLFLPPTHCLTGWLGSPGPCIPDPSSATVPLSPGRRGGGCGC